MSIYLYVQADMATHEETLNRINVELAGLGEEDGKKNSGGKEGYASNCLNQLEADKQIAQQFDVPYHQ